MQKIIWIAVMLLGIYSPVRGETVNDTTLGWLGVVVEKLSPAMLVALGIEHGVLISDVIEDSPADAAGLKMGDVIMSLNQVQIDDPEELGELVRGNPGKRVEIIYLRHQKQETLAVQLDRRPRKNMEWEFFLGLTRRLERTLQDAWRYLQLDRDIYQKALDSLRNQIIELEQELGKLKHRFQQER